jgi:methylase of polypeptide subunit release factors
MLLRHCCAFFKTDLQCRAEPEAYTTYLAELLKRDSLIPGLLNQDSTLHITDFCSGTGCIALLLWCLLQPVSQNLNVRGIDISPQAVSLSRYNTRHNITRGYMPGPSSSQSIEFSLGDIFSKDILNTLPQCDILISNPPYVSRDGFARDTARSVRNYEPRLAQVPTTEAHGGECQKAEDMFYARLLEIGRAVRSAVMLFETGGMGQALRVASMAVRAGHLDGMRLEIWRDWPDAMPGLDEAREVVVDGQNIDIRGSGHGRSVLIYKTT